MAQVFLHISTNLNRVLNNDLTTVLRSITLLQGATYTFHLAFYQDGAATLPDISDFNFSIRANGSSANLVSVSTLTTGTGIYPYTFTLTVSSPTLAMVLGSEDSANLLGYITWTADGEEVLLEPFTVRTINAASNGDEVDYVMSLNGLEGTLGLTGSGSVTVTQSGSTINIEGTAPEIDLSEVEADIAALQAASSTYYLASNPNAFITASALTPYATTTYVGNALTSLLSTTLNTSDIVITKTSRQQKWLYDSGNHLSLTVSSNGNVTFAQEAGGGNRTFTWSCDGVPRLTMGDNNISAPGAYNGIFVPGAGAYDANRVRIGCNANNETGSGLSDGGAVNRVGFVAGGTQRMLLTTTGFTSDLPIYAPTATTGTNTTQVATTAFVNGEVGSCVKLTGNQSVAGLKTFSSAFVASVSVTTPTLSGTVGGSGSIALNSKNLGTNAKWTHNGETLAQAFPAKGILTKIIPAQEEVEYVPGTNAVIELDISSMPTDGDQFSFSYGGMSVTFEFDNDNTYSNTRIDVSSVYSYSDFAYAIANGVSAIFTTQAGFSVSGNVLTVTATTAEAVTMSFSGALSGSDTGVAPIPYQAPTNESGTRAVMIMPACSYSASRRITQIIARKKSGSAWANASIIIGYSSVGVGDEDEFTPLFKIDRAALTSGSKTLYLGNGITFCGSDADFDDYFTYTAPNYMIMARTVDPNDDTIIADELSGSDVVIVVHGHTA